MTDYISPSSIKLFFQCPYRWYLTNLGIEGIVIDDTYLRFGRMVHHMIQQFYMRLPKKVTDKDIESLAWKIFDECFDDTLSYKKNDAKRVIENFIKHEKQRLKTWKTFRPIFVEQRFKLNDKLVGVIDFYGDNTIIDWKTGTYTYMSTDLMRQGGIYKYFLEQAGYRVDRVLFVFLKDNRIVELPKITRGWIESEINKMEKLIESGHFPKKQGYYCRYCEYRLRCEFDNTCLWKL